MFSKETFVYVYTETVAVEFAVLSVRASTLSEPRGKDFAKGAHDGCNFAVHLFYLPPLQRFYSLSGAVLEQIGNLVRVRLIQLLAGGFDRHDLFLGQLSISPRSRIKCAQIIPLVPPVPVFTAGK